MLDFAQARRTMVDSQLRTYDVTDRALLAAMSEVPREAFMPKGREVLAYSDLGIDLSNPRGPDPRVMLAPMVLARLIQALDIEAGESALDVASGLGYAAAVMAALGAKVVALESDDAMVAQGRGNPALSGVRVEAGPPLSGLAAAGPYDVILVNGAIAARPDALLAQLADGGRLACLLHGEGPGRAVLYVKSGDVVGQRALFDAMAPLLAGAAREVGFVF